MIVKRCDSAVFDNCDSVGVHYTGNTLCYHDNGRVFELLVKLVSEFCFRSEVKCRRAVVEYEYLGIAENRSRYSHSLLLTAGKRRALFSYI